MSRVMISAAAYLLSFLFQPSLLWVFLPGSTLWSKKGRGRGGVCGGVQVNSWFKEPPLPPQLNNSSVAAAAAKIVQIGRQDTEVSRTLYLNSEKCNGAPPGGDGL